MKRTRASPSSFYPKVTLYSLVPPSASTSSSSEILPLPSSSSTSSSSKIESKPRRKSTLVVSSRSYAEEEDEDDKKIKKESPSDDDQDDFLPSASTLLRPLPSRPSTTSTSSRKKPKLSSPTKSASSPWKAPPEPTNWKSQVDAIREMRKSLVAPVDDMGCAAAGRQESDPIRARFSVLISLMLSSQTKGESDGIKGGWMKIERQRGHWLELINRLRFSFAFLPDEMTHRAMGKLREALPGGLSAHSLAEADDEVIKTAISSV